MRYTMTNVYYAYTCDSFTTESAISHTLGFAIKNHNWRYQKFSTSPYDKLQRAVVLSHKNLKKSKISTTATSNCRAFMMQIQTKTN